MTVTELMMELQRLAGEGEGGRKVVMPSLVDSYDVKGVTLGNDHTALIDW